MPRSAELIASLRLEPHPEGGFYREIHRSLQRVQPLGGRQPRAAMTVIYYLLEGGRASRFHSIGSDEVWQHVLGGPVELFHIDAGISERHRLVLGQADAGGGAEPVRIIPAGHWQSARTLGGYSLVTCTVAPGFEFADFALLLNDTADAELVRRHFPDVASLI